MSKSTVGESPCAPSMQDISLEKRILQAIKNSSEPMSESALLSQVSGRKQSKVKAIRLLIEKEKVTRTGSGKKGDPFLYDISRLDSNADEFQSSSRSTQEDKLEGLDFKNLVELFQLLKTIKQRAC